MLLEHFPGAVVTLVDVSLMMLGAARQRLERFGDRVEYVQAKLAHAEWTGAVGNQFDFVLSTQAVHDVGGPERIRALYAEVLRMLGHGGTFLNLDFVRPARPSLAGLAAWAARDAEAGFSAHRHDDDELPGSLLEHLSWLGEAGFSCVDVLWKDLETALLCGVRDHFHLPEAAHSDGHGHSH